MNWKRIISLVGAIVAFSIGSGFATGQESLQFFASYGVAKCIGAAVITMILYIWICSVVMQDGSKLKLQSANEIWVYYCGKYFGTALKYFTPIFLFAILVVMTSGAGATINQYYGLSSVYGRVLIVILMLATVMLGMNKITKLIGVLGILIIVFTLLIGIISLVINVGNLSTATAYLEENPVAKAAPTWWISGILYTTFMTLNLGPFLAGIGPDCEKRSDAKLGGLGGGIAFSACLIVMALAILANIQTAGDMSVPTLVIAESISPVFGVIFSIVLIAGIFTTTVSLLWISCNFVAHDEKSKKFRITALIACIIIFIGSKLPFSTLVNIIYPYTGYLGIIICLCIAYTHYFKKEKIHPETKEPVE